MDMPAAIVSLTLRRIPVIARAVQAALSQTHPDAWMPVADHGSTDHVQRKSWTFGVVKAKAKVGTPALPYRGTGANVVSDSFPCRDGNTAARIADRIHAWHNRLSTVRAIPAFRLRHVLSARQFLTATEPVPAFP